MKEGAAIMEVRRSHDRGYADHGWLKSFQSFSFADYYDPEHIEFGSLRVFNDDRVEPGADLGLHEHRDMEIVTYVLEGAIEHQDSLGNEAVIRPGDVQRLSAGRGVQHRRRNASKTQHARFLQMWIRPSEIGVPPTCEFRHFPVHERRGCLRMIASPKGENGSLRIHQNVRIYAGLFDGAERATFRVGANRRGYVHLASGCIAINDTWLKAGDAVMIRLPATLELHTARDAEVLAFDLPVTPPPDLDAELE